MNINVIAAIAAFSVFLISLPFLIYFYIKGRKNDKSSEQEEYYEEYSNPKNETNDDDISEGLGETSSDELFINDKISLGTPKSLSDCVKNFLEITKQIT